MAYRVISSETYNVAQYTFCDVVYPKMGLYSVYGAVGVIVCAVYPTHSYFNFIFDLK